MWLSDYLSLSVEIHA